jgi:rhodanese-related sulfurtransferase
MTSVGRIDPLALHCRMSEHEPLTLLDVREPFERAIATIATPPHVVALAIPMGEIPARVEEIRGVGASPIVVYCHHGQRSMHAARWLTAQGLTDLLNLEGGIDAWSKDVDPATPRY